MKSRSVALAAALLVFGVAGCSGSGSSVALDPGELPGGTAQITVNGVDIGPAGAVSCHRETAFTTITTGDANAGSVSVVNNKKGLVVDSVDIRNLGGFTGTYLKDLEGQAKLEVSGSTYVISGKASGFTAENPHQRTDDAATFAIRAAC